jgi:hypothetical protein
MDKAAKRRWGLLSSLMTGTLAAIFYPVDEARTPLQQSRPSATSNSAPAANVLDAENGTPAWVAANTDPFAPRGWAAAPLLSAAAPSLPMVAMVANSAAPTPAPVPPPLPYKFVGQMRDGGDTVVYLSVGDQMVLARAGETLAGGYKVAAITVSHIEFESIALGIRQALQIPNQE